MRAEGNTFAAKKFMQIKLIETGTMEYEEMVNLRKKVLLDPFDIPHTYINPDKEKESFLIGAFDDQLAGCCMLTKLDDTTLQLRQMVVDTASQKSGIGMAIVAFAESTAIEHGYRRIKLHARDTAKGFYSKCGYKVEGDEFLEVGLKHFMMGKELPVK